MTACLLLLPLIARAGSYSAPAYSGGTVTIAYPSGPASFNYSLNSQDNTWGGRYYASGYADSSISVTCSDPIGTTFTWNNGGDPNDLPPQCVILTEYCQTYWYGSSNNGTVTGDCSNPMGGSAVPYSPPPGSFWETTKYSVITNPPATLSISSSPSATATSAASSYPGTGVASVKYSASVSPVTISFTGTSTDVDGSLKALAGQEVTAHLNLGGVPLKVSSYTWSFTGTTPIKNWEPSWPNATNPNQTVPLAPSDLSQTDTSGNGIAVNDLSFYETTQSSLVVTCTVNFTFPDGTTATATAQSPPISYKKPTATWILNNNFNNFAHSAGFFNDPTNALFGAHEIWGAITISVPDPFSGGTGCVAQIANLDRSWARNPQNGKPGLYSKLSVLYADGSSSMVTSPTGLDATYPYPFGYNKNPDGTYTLVNGSYTWAVGNMGYSDDQPFQRYTTTDVDMGGTQWYSSTANDQFNTWVMYRPPSAGGQGTIYVPLQKLAWSWGGNANLVNNVWNVAEGPSFVPGSPAATDAYPSWNLEIPLGFTVGP